MESNSLRIAHVSYTFEGQIWVAQCDEVGMVGYQGKSLEKVKNLVNEGLQVFFEDNPFEVIESITAESEFNLK
jgi:predicted RNase H-like HicB family nuclease